MLARHLVKPEIRRDWNEWRAVTPPALVAANVALSTEAEWITGSPPEHLRRAGYAKYRERRWGRGGGILMSEISRGRGRGRPPISAGSETE
jgi:hypothetical protein